MGKKAVGREKRKKGAHTAADMKQAIDHHLRGFSIRKSAKEYNIPYPTLRRYVIKYLKDDTCSLVPNYEVNSVFTPEQENELKEYAIECAQKFYGLSSKEFRKVAFQMAKINNIKMPSTWETNKMAGKDWLQAFKHRHPDISVKKAEACSLARASSFNKTNVNNFFGNLKEVLQRHPSFSDGSRIFNLDETATTTVQRPQKVAQKGKSTCKITSGERGTLVTTCCIVSASGQALPPAMVFPRKKFQNHMTRGALPGTLGLAAASGWMNSDIFVDVMRHFIKHSSASITNPALLIMDNHESHLSVEALELAKSSGVTILTLHPHTTAKMQPLDVGLHAPFKAFYNSAVDSWLMQNPGKNFTIYNVADCVSQAYLKSMTPMNITKSFKKCGIFPFDDTIFTDIDFLPSSVTDRPPPQPINDDEIDGTDNEETPKRPEEDAPPPQPIDNDEIDETDNEEIPKRPEVDAPQPQPIDNDEIDGTDNEGMPKRPKEDAVREATPTSLLLSSEIPIRESTPELSQREISFPETKPSSSKLSPSKSPMPQCQNAAKNLTSKSTPNKQMKRESSSSTNNTITIRKPLADMPIRFISPKLRAAIKTEPPSSSKLSPSNPPIPQCQNAINNLPIKFISPKMFRPAIKAEPRKGSKRKLGKSIIATDTPEKNAIEEKKNKKKKEDNKRVKLGVKKVKQDLFKEKEPPKKHLSKDVETSDDSDEEFQASGSSSGGERYISISEDEEIMLDDNFPPLSRDPREGEYVIIVFTSKKDKVYYIAKILEIIDDDDDFDFSVSYLKLKSKAKQKFIDPIDIETAGVSLQDIKYILPAPKFEGTSRRKTTLKFPIDMSRINLRY
ncbi:hypothetical protein O0L34_g19464 [Tuta absoluta]|nr:hypothetical protein O0L34_g19464 [Tuta absoluta]